MHIDYGKGKTEYGPGVEINLTGNEVAQAITEYVYRQGVDIRGPRTIRVNGELCEDGEIYVDPSGSVLTDEGHTELSGRGLTN